MHGRNKKFKNINWEKVYFVSLYCIIILQCTAQKHDEKFLPSSVYFTCHYLCKKLDINFAYMCPSSYVHFIFHYFINLFDNTM